MQLVSTYLVSLYPKSAPLFIFVLKFTMYVHTYAIMNKYKHSYTSCTHYM
jgi:hypothetical protein